jgi:hypothetical protein
MHREISSAATPIYKALFLLMFGGSAPYWILSRFYNLRDSPKTAAADVLIGILLIIAELIFAFLFVRLALSWKRVEMEDSGLTVININFFVKKVSTFVPFENIKRARQPFLLQGNPGTVFIEFNEPTFFGKKISFVPQFRAFTFTTHPIVGEINRLSNNAFLN